MRLLSRRQLPFLLAVATFVAWFVLLRPTTLGGPTSYLWVSGTSMQPTLDEGDFVVASQADDYGPGDIVAFRIPQGDQGEGGLVIHRIVGGSATDGYVTQGDNKPRADPWRPRPGNILGAMWFAVPGAGPYVRVVREPAVISALAGSLVVFMLMLSGGGGDTTSPRRRPGWFVRLRAPRRQRSSGGEFVRCISVDARPHAQPGCDPGPARDGCTSGSRCSRSAAQQEIVALGNRAANWGRRRHRPLRPIPLQDRTVARRRTSCPVDPDNGRPRRWRDRARPPRLPVESPRLLRPERSRSRCERASSVGSRAPSGRAGGAVGRSRLSGGAGRRRRGPPGLLRADRPPVAGRGAGGPSRRGLAGFEAHA